MNVIFKNKSHHEVWFLAQSVPLPKSRFPATDLLFQHFYLFLLLLTSYNEAACYTPLF